MIYFIKSPTGAIKIGTTIRLSQRLKQLAAEHGPGLEVLAVADGSFEVERALHRRFAHLRQVGEWFEPGDDLMGFIVSDGKPWDSSEDNPPTVPIKVDRGIAAKAKIVASDRGIDLAAYVSEVLRATVDKDWSKIVKRIDSAEVQDAE